jgi:hypothetical protein
MEHAPRYEIVDSGGEPTIPVGVTMAVESQEDVRVHPPAYHTLDINSSEDVTDTTPLVGAEVSMPVPPAYDIATNLPSYDEAEKSKADEAARQAAVVTTNHTRPFSFHLFQLRSTEDSDEAMLGTDGLFACTFLLAFIFNWLGLLVSLCVTETIAGRLGALSGFGLSLVKYMMLLSHSGFTPDMKNFDTIVWWLLLVVGFLIFFRGISQYIRVKYMWPKLNLDTKRRMFNHYY